MALKDERQMIPADNVDSNGTAWSTIGENIRKGKNGPGGSGGGDATLTKETIANFYNSLTGGDWRVADMTISRNDTNNDIPSVEYNDVDYSDQLAVSRAGITCRSGIMGTPIYLGTVDPMNVTLRTSEDPMFFTTQKRYYGNYMCFGSRFTSQGLIHARVLLPFQYADSSVNSWNHNSEDDWGLKVQKWQKEDAEAVQKTVSEEQTEV